jgi:hypothetical protein
MSARLHLLCYLLSHLCKLLEMSLFQLLNGLERCDLIVSHVLIPRLVEFFELCLLGGLNSCELLFLSEPHVLSLPDGLNCP